jgi:NADPH:quinone reductase-like Zn-dependent oxidoreductase
MRAVRVHEHGGPEVLKVETLDDPVLRCGEVLVKVRACALNHLDLWVRRGIPGVRLTLPRIPGSDISGVVKDVGDGVDHIKSGEEVFLSPGTSCGHCRECLSGQDNLCREYKIFGYLRDGGYADYVVSPAENVMKKPDNLSFTEAASFPLTFMTSWHMLITRAGLKMGEDLLVLAAGSGVGTAAIQIGKLMGANVIATAGTAEKLERAKALGADHLINHTEEDFQKQVNTFTQKKGVDVVFEHVGSATWKKSVLSLATNGRLVTCGATTGYEAQVDLRYLFAKHLTLYGSYMGTKGEMMQVTHLMQRGTLRPVVDTVFPLEAAGDAHAHLEKREQFGKVVLEID